MVLETYNFVMNHRFLRVMILALMVFSLIFCGFMVEYSHAIAFAFPAIAVCATLLVACGVISATDTDLESVATAFHNSLNSQASQEILAIASEYSKVTSGGFTFRPTKAIVNAVADWISSTFDPVNSIINIDGSLSVDNIDFSWCDVYLSTAFYDLEQADKIAVCNNIPPTSLLGTVFPSGYKVNLLDNGYYDVCYFLSNTNSWVSLWETSHFFVKGFCVVLRDDAYYLYFNRYETETAIFGDGWSSFPLSTSTSTVTTFPKTQAETDSTYFPKEVVDAAGGTTTFPSNTASKPLTTETPLTIPQEGVNSTTLPTDVRTDAGTAEGEDTGTIIGWLEKVWDGVTAIPDVIAGAGTAVIDFLTDLVVPSDTVWDDFMTDVVDIVSPPNAVNFNKYVSSIAIPDVTVNWKGQTLTIVDNSNLRDNVTTWRKYIGAFLAVLLMIYNYNMFMKLMGLGTLTLTESGRVPDVSINNLSGNVALPAPKGKR